MNTATKESTNGDVPLKQETILLPNDKAGEFVIEAPQPLTDQAAQALFKRFLEENGLAFEAFVITPRTGTLVPVAEFLPPGWEMVAVKMVTVK